MDAEVSGSCRRGVVLDLRGVACGSGWIREFARGR